MQPQPSHEAGFHVPVTDDVTTLATYPLLAALFLLAIEAQLVLDVAYSITGFCIGFLYARWLYLGRNGRRHARP